jgi:hypothetical protein
MGRTEVARAVVLVRDFEPTPSLSGVKWTDGGDGFAGPRESAVRAGVARGGRLIHE